MQNVRDSDRLGKDLRAVAIALDTKGPEIRAGDIADPEGLQIPQGHQFILTTDPDRRHNGDLTAVFVDYPQIGRTLGPDSLVYVDDGNLQLKVLEALGDEGVRVEALNAHRLLSRKGVNLPYARVDLPAVSEKDREDLAFAVHHRLDMIFASFIRKPQDILAIRQLLGEAGRSILIIAKIENHEGVRNFDDILAVADGVMVARGDLGIEIPPEKVFLAQKMMIARCNIVGKPVICATQMLESMTHNPRPTRAEASDVANAVLDGADCVMLSAETARGAYPVRTVEMMAKICLEAESTIAYLPLYEELRKIANVECNLTQSIAACGVNASLEPFIHAIIALTSSGDTARRLAKFRPQVPIVTVTRSGQTARQIHLHRGCYPLIYPFPPATKNTTNTSSNTLVPSTSLIDEDSWQLDVQKRIAWAMEEAKRLEILKSGQHVVVIQGSRAGSGFSNTMRIVCVP